MIADSLSPEGHRLTTMELVFPRIILSEFNTHRVFSRNSASSRAIPASRMREMVELNPYIPARFTSNKPGMQGGEFLADGENEAARNSYYLALQGALTTHRELEALGVHKQHANRILEPWMWHTVVVSSTEWDNFFNLRLNPAAQPEIQGLAFEMYQALLTSAPVQFQRYDEWHLPYITDEEKHFDQEMLKKVSVARCARVSYMRQNDQREYMEDVVLYMRLRDAGHWSPFEHVATPTTHEIYIENEANFMGWVQLRHVVESEDRTKEAR